MRFVSIESYMIPTFGNCRTEPYGRMVVEHNGETRTVRFGERDGSAAATSPSTENATTSTIRATCTPLYSSLKMRSSQPSHRSRRRRRRRRI